MTRLKKILWTALKGAGATVAAVLLLLFLLPILFPGAIAEQIKTWTNESIEGELQFSKTRLSFFEHFPSLTLTLYDFSLTGSAPFAGDTLLAGEALSFGLNLASVFGETLEVNTFYIDDARINVQVDTLGQANYNVYKGSPDDSSQPDSSNTRLKIAGIFFRHCHLTYDDRSIPLRMEAKDFNYEGRGDLANSQFDLQSNMSAASFDFVYDGTPYFLNRKLKADLLTGINTSSLVFRFAKNELLINKLPVDFSGEMAILKDGYDIDLNVVSGTTDFANIFSALPPEYDQWFSQTQFSGQSQIRVALKGKYRAATAEAPDLSIGLWVHDGSIRHNNAPAPLQHFWVNGKVEIPGLQPDKFSLTLDTLMFDLDGAPTRATVYVKGIEQPYIKTDIRSRLDLALLDKALGLTAVDLRGWLDLQFRADGTYRSKVLPDRSEAITAIPAYQLDAGIQNGYFKYTSFELPLEQLQAQVRSACTTGRWQDISFSIDSLRAVPGNGSISGSLSVSGMEKSAVKARLKANLQLEDFARIFPVQDYRLGGALDFDIQTDGTLDAGKKLFPATTAALQLKNGVLQTPYYPRPIEQLNINASLKGKTGTYNDLGLQLQPLSFVFEQQPFTLAAEVRNPGNLRYDISARGALDLGKIYRVFAVEGYQVTGMLQADFSAQGTEADAVAGRYQRLQNKGTLRLANLELRSDDYPDPFFVPGSTLRFEQDKAWLSDAVLRYRKNEFTLNGYAQNMVGYVLSGSPLQGELSVSSPRIVIDDFMALAAPSGASRPAATPAPSGVVLLPADMDLSLKASAAEVLYGQTKIEHFSGELAMQKGKLLLRDTRFNIAGANVGLEGSYTPVSPRKALFGLTFKADSFDVKRAYDEVPLFREMASAAEKASGLVSLQYQLEGRLNDRMEPVYPSIKGKGWVKLEQVKVKGLKLFGAVSKATGKDDINDPDLKAVVMRSSVANNIITLERTKMKVLGFRPRIEGQTSLDGRLNLRFRLGLPPFGLIGIPMTITGTSDDPQVEVRKGKEADELEEEVDDEDDQGG